MDAEGDAGANVVFEAPDDASDSRRTHVDRGEQSGDGTRGARGDVGRIPGTYWVGDRAE